jgi:hypothetical protein
MAGVPYSTAARWCQNDPVLARKDGANWRVSQAEAKRVIDGRRKAELIEDRLSVILDHLALERDKRTTAAAAAAREVGDKIHELSREQLADRAQLRALVAPLSLAVRAIEDLAVLDLQLDELSRQTRDDEWTRPEDYNTSIEQDSALVAACAAAKSPPTPAKRKPAKRKSAK